MSKRSHGSLAVSTGAPHSSAIGTVLHSVKKCNVYKQNTYKREEHEVRLGWSKGHAILMGGKGRKRVCREPFRLRVVWILSKQRRISLTSTVWMDSLGVGIKPWKNTSQLDTVQRLRHTFLGIVWGLLHRDGDNTPPRNFFSNIRWIIGPHRYSTGSPVIFHWHAHIHAENFIPRKSSMPSFGIEQSFILAHGQSNPLFSKATCFNSTKRHLHNLSR